MNTTQKNSVGHRLRSAGSLLLGSAGLALAAFGGCSTGQDGVANPTWVEDLRPVVQANCLRCHSVPAIAGAPQDFRLDSYEDTVLADGRVVRGAKTMAAFMAIRAGEEGTMPPDFDRSPGQRDTFVNWRADGQPLGARSQNATPRISLLSPLETADLDIVAIDYEVVDNDGDLVTGQLELDGEVVGDLRNGRGRIDVSPAALPDGVYPLRARLSDDESSVTRDLGELRVAHEGGTAPALRFSQDLRDALLTDLRSPMALGLEVSDPDSLEAELRVDLHLVRGDQDVVVAEDMLVVAGSIDLSWDTTTLPEGNGFRLRAEASDGEHTTSIVSGPFAISHASTDLRFADIVPLLQSSCLSCHPRSGITGIDFFKPDVDSGELVPGEFAALSGKIYRRVVLEKNMPPASAATFDPSWQELDDADRARLAEYLLGGSPE